MGARPRLAVLIAGIVAACGGILYATPAVPCACSTPSYAAPFNTVPPTVSGTLTVGSVLSTTTGTWANDVSSGYAYQWKDGSGNIAGATSSTYTITSGETGAYIHVTVTATGTGGSTGADSNIVGPVTNPGSLTTANVWISTAGNDGTCARSASAITYASAVSGGNVCATGPGAYKVASLGDTVLVEGSPLTVTSAWTFSKTITKTVTAGTCNYNYGGTPNLSSCVTIEPASGQSLVFDVAGTNIQQVSICVSGLALGNFTVNETDYTDTFGDTVSNGSVHVGSGDNTCGTVIAPHDDYIFNGTYGGQAGIQGGVTDVSFVGGTAASTTDFPWQFGGAGDNGAFPYVETSAIVGVTFEGYNFVNSDPGHHHMECVHANGAVEDSFFAGNRVLTCPVESVFFETLNSSSNIVNDTIENNYFDASSGGGLFKMDCANNGCTVSSNTIRFNSFVGGWLLECSASTSGGCNVNNNVFYGNIGIGCTAVSYPSGGSITGTGWVNDGYNVQTVAKANTCTSATSAYSATVTYTSVGPPNYNLDLNGAQTATNFVPNSVTWPAGNIYGVARSGATTNAGGD